jgi:hypothetical protein
LDCNSSRYAQVYVVWTVEEPTINCGTNQPKWF